MKQRLTFRILAVALTLSLLLAALPVSPALAQSVVISPSVGSVSTSVIVIGAGLTDGDTYSIIFGYGSIYPQTLVTGVVAGGGFVDSFNVPIVPRGTYTVRTEIIGVAPLVSSSPFAVMPKITGVTPTSGQVGDQFTVSGTGFATN